MNVVQRSTSAEQQQSFLSISWLCQCEYCPGCFWPSLQLHAHFPGFNFIPHSLPPFLPECRGTGMLFGVSHFTLSLPFLPQEEESFLWSNLPLETVFHELGQHEYFPLHLFMNHSNVCLLRDHKSFQKTYSGMSSSLHGSVGAYSGVGFCWAPSLL